MVLNIVFSVYLFINFVYLIAILKKNFAVVDIAWGLGFVLIAILNFLSFQPTLRHLLILFVVGVWGLRLAIYLYFRNRGKPEDFRYADMRSRWGKTAELQAYFKVFLLQSTLMLVVGSPILFGFNSEEPMSPVHWLGLLIWALGFSLEVTSDSYLAWFKNQPQNKGKICTTGPWKICRFPNYFGEVMLWYGVYLLCLHPGSTLSLIGPLSIHFLIVNISGIPLLEKHYQDRPEYQEYSKRVPRFFPINLKQIFGRG